MLKHILIGVAAAGVLSAGLATPGFAAGSADIVVDGTGITTDIHAIGNGDLKFRAFGWNQRNHVMVISCPDGSTLETVVFTESGLNLDIPRCF